MDEKKFIGHYLTKKGVLPKYNGYNVLVNAIFTVIEHPEYDNSRIFTIAAKKMGIGHGSVRIGQHVLL